MTQARRMIETNPSNPAVEAEVLVEWQECGVADHEYPIRSR